MTSGVPCAPGPESHLVDVSDEGLKQTRRWGLIIVIGSFLFGFDTGIISGALLFIKDDFGLNAFEQSSVVSVLLLGAIAGALGSGRASDRLGRRKTLGLLGVLFAIGIAIAALAQGYWMMLLGRIVMGVGVGGVSALIPTYLGEISPAQIRGRMLTLNQLLITVGLLSSYIVNLIFAGSGDWRAMFWIGAIPAIALAVGTLRLPESPAWLISHGRTEDARTMLSSVAGPEGAEKVIDRYRREEDERVREETASGTARQKGMAALRSAHVRPALVVGLTLAALQQFAGINTILYYAPTIMSQTGLSAENSIVYSVFIGIVNLGMTVVAIKLVDRVGRRPLLLWSLIIMGVSLVFLGFAFVAELPSGVMLAFILLYIVGFAIGMGPVFWVILGEIFPTRERAVGTGAGSTMNWTTNFIVSLAFLPVVAAIGQGETFWIFAVICAFGVWFVGRYVPETRERVFLEIDADLKERWGGDAPLAEPPPPPSAAPR